MAGQTKLNAFAKFCWFVLGFNVLVILWGVFLRASKSGDGCGQHWLTCHGEVIPSAPELKTIIEFSHRVTSALAGLFLIVLLIWAIRRWYSSRGEQDWRTLKMAIASFVFIVLEGLLGAGLVLTGNTAENMTPVRPIWMAGHLINTFILLALLVLTARYASNAPALKFRIRGKFLSGVLLGVLAIFVVGITGSIAALASMIFPAGSLIEGVKSDFSPTSHLILRLRMFHPATAILMAVFLIFLTGWMSKALGNPKNVLRWANILSILVLAQLAFGTATLFMLAPIVMQLGHLLFADAIWVAYVFFAANFLSSYSDEAISNAELAGSKT